MEFKSKSKELQGIKTKVKGVVPKARIEEITTDGLVTIQFNQDMVFGEGDGEDFVEQLNSQRPRELNANDSEKAQFNVLYVSGYQEWDEYYDKNVLVSWEAITAEKN